MSRKSRILKYVSKNYQWFLGAIFIPLVALLITLLVNLSHPKTDSLYYLPPKEIIANSDQLSTIKCWKSMISSRDDALVCSPSGREDMSSLEDPCFLSENFHTVYCPRSPDSGDSAVFETKKLNGQPGGLQIQNNIDKKPWYIKLSNGIGCNFITHGATAILDGRIDYGCHQSRYSYLMLPIDTTSQPWKIRCYNEKKNLVEQCEVAKVWY